MELESLPAPSFSILSLFGQHFLEKKIPNKILRKYLSNLLFPVKPNKNTIIQKFSETEVKKIRTKYLKFTISPKTKEIHFKILNEIYPSSQMLRKRFGFE